MDHRRLLSRAAVSFFSWLLAACGGGDNHGETNPSTPPTSTASGLDKFLLFPNPQQINASPPPQTDELAYAQAYYAAIDPDGSRDTLTKWKAKNGFDKATRVTVAFGDQRDLGYGRRMTAWRNADGTIAFMVENYQVDPGGTYGYSSVSLEAAIREDKRWRIHINAIEFSPGPAGGESFAKFFNFNPETEARELRVDIDGRGAKVMPGPCITCHGGRGDALIPDMSANGKLVFNLVQNTASTARGDVQAHLAPFEVNKFDFSPLSGFTKADQEANLKTMNMLVLCSYPLPASAPTGVPTSVCTRRPATASEWQGTAADLLIQSYGGDGLPQLMYSDSAVPPDWRNGGQEDLYAKVVAPSCRACHILRGTLGQSDIDFTTLAGFQSFAKTQLEQDPPGQLPDDRIKVHVIDRGDMPLAKLVYDTFWQSTNPGPGTLAAFLAPRGFAVGPAVLPPGRPIADPGPDRVIARGATALSAAASLYVTAATAYHWTILSGPAGATLTNADSMQPTFNATLEGAYVLQLVASNGSVQSAPASLTLFAAATPPKRVVFADIKGVLGPGGTCANCHSPGTAPGPPVFFANSGTTGPTERTDDPTFYAEVRSRINFTDIVASPLLRKPSGRHHGGGAQSGFDLTQPPGNSERVNYDLFVNWILNGAPMI